jgi:hypothetical protein
VLYYVYYTLQLLRDAGGNVKYLIEIDKEDDVVAEACDAMQRRHLDDWIVFIRYTKR